MAFDHRKYRPYRPISLPDRSWPDQEIQKAPQWVSVDLRDGNQALINPMTPQQKQRLFDLLVKIGMKEIEVGFPAASAPDHDFVRQLIEQDRVPADVTLQVLTQAREELIEKTFHALKGARRAIVHLYNSTSPVQRNHVFNLDKSGIIEIACKGVRKIKSLAAQNPGTEWVLEYSPESFSQTEPDFAVEICNAVIQEWQPTPENPIIINLPATVESTTPNLFADQVEYFCRHVAHRDAVIVSVHTHNDRGCAVAAAELAVMAGAQRVEGTLLGNGERTGNMDLVTMAMNLYSQGVDPWLDLSNMDEIIGVVQHCTDIPVHPRHPYAGELVYSAFSGSHQDAIGKCLRHYREGLHWQVAYLPIDPVDLGRSYEAVVRINSQSGKGGVAFVLEHEYGLKLPRWMQIAVSRIVQLEAERQATELSSEAIWALFKERFMQYERPMHLVSYCVEHSETERVQACVALQGQQSTIEAVGQGALSAFCAGLNQHFGINVEILDYEEHSLSHDSDSEAVSYVQVSCLGGRYQGAAIDRDVLLASMNAILSAVNQAMIREHHRVA